METQECLRRIDPARLAAFQAELLRKEYSVGTAWRTTFGQSGPLLGGAAEWWTGGWS